MRLAEAVLTNPTDYSAAVDELVRAVRLDTLKQLQGITNVTGISWQDVVATHLIEQEVRE